MSLERMPRLDMNALRSRHGTRWRVADFTTGALAFALGFYLSPHTMDMPSVHYMLIVGAVHGSLLLLCSRLCGVPNPEQRASHYELVSAATTAVVCAYLIFSVVVWFFLLRVYGRYIVTIMVLFSFSGLVIPRWILGVILHRNPLNVVIYGAGTTGHRLHDRIAGVPGFRVVGFLDNDPDKRGTEYGGHPILGAIHEIGAAGVKQLGTDIVVICVGSNLNPENAAVLLRLPLQGIEVLNKGAFVEHYFKEISVDYDNPHWFASSPSVPGNPSIFAAKRVMDLAVGGPALLVTLPAWVVVAVAVKLESPGPVFFRQRRVGWRGQEFTLVKFRSMATDAEKDGARWAERDDPRATRVGRIIRLTRLDELPQLWNVLRGQMTLVGPRPERPEFVRELAADIPFYEQRHLVPPGLTGWAQIRYRYGASKEDAKRKLEFDLYYVRHLSVGFDIEILLRTIPLVMKGSR